MTTTHRTTGDDLTDAIAQLRARDAQADAASPDPQVTAALRDPDLRLGRRVERVFAGYADRPALGTRTAATVTDPATGRATRELRDGFTTVTYGELWDRVTALSTDLRTADSWADGDDPLAPGDVVGILGFTSVDYATVDLTCVHAAAVGAPLQASATTAQLTPILEETSARVLATSRELLDTAVECVLAVPSIRRVVVIDHHGDVDDDREALDAARTRLLDGGSDVPVEPLDDVLARGRALPAAPVVVPDEDDPLMLLIYTSGSTGTPKGAMYPEHLVATLWSGIWMPSETLPRIGFDYLPMSHLAGRVSLLGSLSAGGTGYFTASSDLSTLFDDLALAAPTDLMLVPRVCDMLRQRYDAELDRRAPDGGADGALREQVLAELRHDLLGGRLLRAHVGSAPVSTEMHEFLEALLGITVHDGYGSTEDGMVLIDHRVQSPPVTAWKLEDVPELGYTTDDTPYPRGELLVRTETAIPGYFRRPDTTAEVFDDDGYYRTGDIMAEVGDDELVYVDRRKNVLKLSQGEFVAVSRLESLFVAAEGVRQIFVHGSSRRSYLLAVVVPTREAIDRAGGAGNDLRGNLLASLQRVAGEQGLNSYEVPREILVETDPFTTENGLLSDARKPLRPRLTEHYGDRLEQLYRELADAQDDTLRDLRRHGRDRPVPETVQRAAGSILETTEVPPLDARFLDFGGDSLSALSFSQLLTEIFSVDVPVGEIASASADLATVAASVRERLEGSSRPTAASVHGAGATAVRAEDLRLETFLDEDLLTRARSLPRATGTPRTVLLTGANGYLGRFLAVEWLERMASTGGTLVCLVRGRDDDGARERLLDVVDSGDDDLSARFRSLAEDHLEVRASDLGRPALGLDDDTWSRLAADVDLIVHPGALVNHVLPYDQLFGPNVLGTVELVRLALAGERLTPVTYLSTVAVVASQTSDPSEDTDIRVTSPERELDGSYANGYATSKWASEVLLREAHDAVGLPVTVFRSDLILAHSTYTGQLNVPDVFTRLLLSVAATGLAPRTFYTHPDGFPTDDAGRPRGHYDGLPADFTAAAVTTLGEQDTDAGRESGYRTFHVLNPHDDGVSLDVVVDWVADAGPRITRVDDHAAWVSRFVSAMRALPDAQRAASALPLMQAFEEPEAPVAGPMAPADDFRAAVRAAGIGPEADVPHLTASLVAKYVSDLRVLGLL